MLFGTLVFVNLANASTDPTRPLSHNSRVTAGTLLVGDDKKLELQSIIKSGEQLTAVISGKLLKLDDRIGQYQVSQITKSYVLLVSGEDKLKLSMFTQVVNAQNE